MVKKRKNAIFYLFMFATIGYWALAVSYIELMQDSVYKITLRLPPINFSENSRDIFLGYLYAVFPLVWTTDSSRPSKGVYIYLYFSVLIPSCLFLTTNQQIPVWDRHIGALFCVACFFVVHMAYIVPTNKVRRLPRQSQLGWGIVWAVTILGPIYLIFASPGSFNNISLLDVYEKRLAVRDAVNDGTFNRSIVYLTNWMGIAIAPFLTVYGVQKRKPVYLVLAAILAFFAFAVSTHKSVLFTSAIVLLVAASIRFTRQLHQFSYSTPLNVAFVLTIGFIALPYAFDTMIGAGPTVSWYTNFRLFLNNGFLTSAYIEFFGRQPALFYADSFLSSIIPSGFDLSYSRRLGDYISNYDGRNNANANFLADGYVNLGYAGMIISSLQLAFVLWLIDSLAQGRDQTLVACVVLPAGLIFSNVPIHTGLISNGIAVSILLITLLPRVRPRPSKAHFLRKPYHV